MGPLLVVLGPALKPLNPHREPLDRLDQNGDEAGVVDQLEAILGRDHGIWKDRLDRLGDHPELPLT